MSLFIISGPKKLSVEYGSETPLNGTCVYILRNSSKRALGEETFQREVMMGNVDETGKNTKSKVNFLTGMVDARLPENLLWNIERIVTKVFIPILNSNFIGDKGSEDLKTKVKNELLPCLRSFTRFVFEAEYPYVLDIF